MISAALAIIEDDIQRNELAKFYEDHKNDFINIAYKYVHNAADAEDAIEEAFFRIVQKPEKFFSLSTEIRVYYTIAIIKNVAIDIYNAKSKLTNKFPEDVICSSSVEEIIIDELNHSELYKYINELPPLQHNVLVLIRLSGLTVSEASQLLKISEKSVYQRLHQARKTLKQYITEREKADE